ncbi:HORMA-domain-containing protein [Fistulina hepatica ATCC 64428]|nr:HORMA-domain-containing protein [Fistulina hepatica ATCC 64428]
MAQVQKSRNETKAVTSTQSLESVKTLIQAGMGCIAFLRDLLPEDNFTPTYLTTSDDSFATPNSGSDSARKRNVNGFKIMTLTRGYTQEADRLLNYLEYGIFDALQKKFLKRFIFAIYLDPKDPNKQVFIIEAYTFNFEYHNIPGTDTVVPIMSLGDSLENMSLSSRDEDPVQAALKRGHVPTFKEVKKSVKNLLKTLIQCANQMDSLPKRRFATFKIFYTDETPSEYEPPYFKAGDIEKDRWYFMTHAMNEVPDQWNVGDLRTGHHSVSLDVTSIATYLPSSTEHDESPFLGTTQAKPMSLSPVEEAATRVEEAAKQATDATKRNVVWEAELGYHVDDTDADAEAEDDPDYLRTDSGSYKLRTVCDSGVDSMMPLGLRNDKGEIVPIPKESVHVERQDENTNAHFAGVSQHVPMRLHDMTKRASKEDDIMEETQPITPTHRVLESMQFMPGHAHVVTTPQNISDIPSPLSNLDSEADNGLKLERLDLNASVTADAEMLDLETQPQLDMSFMYLLPSQGDDTMDTEVPETPTPSVTRRPRRAASDHLIECACGIATDDGAFCQCDGQCKRWSHIWCMGYHSVTDQRLPAQFVCFECRVRADNHWELIKTTIYPQMLVKFQALALFRRAIKIAETGGPCTPATFGKAWSKGLIRTSERHVETGCDSSLGRQLFKRLLSEDFIMERSVDTDAMGIRHTRSKAKPKGKVGKNPRRKAAQRTTYIFNWTAKSTIQYSNYFNPDVRVENELLGVHELEASIKLQQVTPGASTTPARQAQTMLVDSVLDSQTQEETQLYPVEPVAECATIMDAESSRPTKRKKMSLAVPVDLAE